MNLISLVGASKDFGVKNLFSDLTLHIQGKERLGLIGPNGAGKSTLLKILAGIEPLGEGVRNCSEQIKIELVGQESIIKPGRTVIEEVLAGCGEKRDLLLKFNELSEAIAIDPNNTNLLKEIGQISERMDAAQAWSLENQCKEVLHRLGITDLNQQVEKLSGGFRKRVGLASALVSKPDVLLLDEPTNHLDANAVEWFQGWLEHYPGALILVTHDRYVLDRVTRRMVEIDGGEAINYEGNYSKFLQQKTQKETSKEISQFKFKGILRRELAWLKQGPKARSTKQKARLKRIKEMQEISLKKKPEPLEISRFQRRVGKLVIEAEDLQLTTNDKADGLIILDSFSYSFEAEDRVGIIGPNGSGKSTLLDLIAGKRKPTRGKIRIGETIQIGYLDQHTDDFITGKGLERKVLEFVEESATQIKCFGKQITASQLLERFLFPPSQQHSPLKKLSGGERRRLTLCRMLMLSPNVLLLDEPTNDLDISTLSILEDFLEDFNGCVIIVSHDRYFLDRTVDRIFSFEDNKLRRFEGNYSSFLEKQKTENKSLILTNKKESITKGNNSFGKDNPLEKESPKSNSFSILEPKFNQKKKCLSFKERQELKDIDQSLPLLEEEKIMLENDIRQGSKDIVIISKRLAKIVEEIKLSEDRWLELSERNY